MLLSKETLTNRYDSKSTVADVFKCNVKCSARYAAVIGQVPEWHPYLVGSLWLSKALAAQPFVDLPDPLRTIVKVFLL